MTAPVAVTPDEAMAFLKRASERGCETAMGDLAAELTAFRQQAEAASNAQVAELREAYHHHLSEVCAECYAGEGMDAFLAAMEFLSKRDKERCRDLFEDNCAKSASEAEGV